jgi:3-oxoacyl-[acyl-carrier protein] reductase
MDLLLKNKTVLITGGARGIGKGIAQVLAQEGCHIILNYNSSALTAEETAHELESKYSIRVYPIQADISNKQSIKEMFCEIENIGLSVDYLVNNAGGGVRIKEPFDVQKSEDWDYIFRLNLFGTVWCSQYFVRHHKKSNSPGAVVNLSSKTAILSSSIYNEAYASAKGGILSLTLSMAKELIDEHIRVNCLIPGYVQSESHFTKDDPRTEEKKKLLPTKAFALPTDIGYSAAFLLSPLASQINGACLDCTGGTLI